MAENNYEMGGFGGMGWLIVILLFFMAFSGGNGLFGGGSNNTGNQLSNVERDVLRGQGETSNQILSTSCSTQKEVFQNRYDNALATQSLGAKLDACLKNFLNSIKKFLCKTILQRSSRHDSIVICY